MSETEKKENRVNIGGLSVPRMVLAGVIIAVYVGGAAFFVGYSNRNTATTAGPQGFNECWDRATVPRGTPCSTEYNSDTLFWVFGIDQGKDDCERSDSYEWADIGYSCEPEGTELRLAIWQTPQWRDLRLAEYGVAKPIGRGLLQHGAGTAGSEGRVLIRYDSDVALMYASVKISDSAFLNRLIPQVKSRTALLYGVPKSPTPSPSSGTPGLG